MEAKATLRFLKASPQKVRLIADLVSGKAVEEAYQILRFTRKMAAKDLEKLLRSAVANAENSEDAANVDDLVVSRIFVNKGPVDKRVRPASMGRAFRIIKRQSHVTIHVSDDVEPVNKRTGGTAAAKKRPVKAGAKSKSGAARKPAARAQK